MTQDEHNAVAAKAQWAWSGRACNSDFYYILMLYYVGGRMLPTRHPLTRLPCQLGMGSDVETPLACRCRSFLVSLDDVDDGPRGVSWFRRILTDPQPQSDPCGQMLPNSGGFGTVPYSQWAACVDASTKPNHTDEVIMTKPSA